MREASEVVLPLERGVTNCFHSDQRLFGRHRFVYQRHGYADHQFDGADNEVSRAGWFRRCRQLLAGRWHFVRRQSPEWPCKHGGQ
jgi:hypothetical protein